MLAHTEPDGPAENWKRPVVVETRLEPGVAVIAVAATNASEGPAGLLGLVELTTPSGVRTVATDASWKTVDKEPSGDWRSAGYDDGAWAAAKVIAPWGQGPWGKVAAAWSPAAQLRHEFRLPAGKTVARARLYSSALGLYDAHLNGARVGEDRLAPGWTDYRERVQYQTYDVTDWLTSGANALGVTLAAGWYAGNVAWFGPHQYGERPAFIGQLEVTYTDGSTDRRAVGLRLACGHRAGHERGPDVGRGLRRPPGDAGLDAGRLRRRRVGSPWTRSTRWRPTGRPGRRPRPGGARGGRQEGDRAASPVCSSSTWARTWWAPSACASGARRAPRYGCGTPRC